MGGRALAPLGLAGRSPPAPCLLLGEDLQKGVCCSPGMDVLNEAIEKLTRGPGRERWTPSLIRLSDTAMRVHPVQVGRRPGL